MKRFGLDALQDWFARPNRKPMVLRGARQVGKSTLVRIFAGQAGLDLMEINLERYLYLENHFKRSEIELILKEIQGITKKTLNPNTLLFLDEIQATPHALACLRYFKEDRPELPVIAAGSLLEFTLSDHSFSMPVGRIEYRHLGPLTFKEYLYASAPELVEHVESCTPDSPVPQSVHQQLTTRQREYMMVGGMPEAVNEYLLSGSFENVQDVHRSICDTYLDDFSKYARKNDLLLLQTVFRNISRSIGKKVKYQAIYPDERAAKVRLAIDLLIKARVVNGVFSSKCTGIPLYGEINQKVFKPLFLDIGLVNYLTGLDWLAISSLTDRDLITEGALAEQFVGQHLAASPDLSKKPEIVYWLREARSSNAEVDYVISIGNWIIPVEVKAGKSGTLKSLHQFIRQKKPQIALRFDLKPVSMQQVDTSVKTAAGVETIKFNLLSLPLYAVEEIPRLITDLRTKQ